MVQHNLLPKILCVETTGLISCQPRSCCLKTTGEVVFAAAGRIALQGRADEGMLVCES